MSLKEIEAFSTTRLPTIIVAQDTRQDGLERSLNWRVARYYLSEQDIWVVAEQENPQRVWVARRDQVSPPQTGFPVKIPVSAPARILWLMDRGGRFHQALEKAVPLHSGRKIFYTDILEDAGPIQVSNFQFVPP